MLKLGTTIKNFKLEDGYGKLRSLYDYQGKKVVLFFYPKNNTTSCTIEACSFRDYIEEFEKRNVEVIGISRDSVSSHYKFSKKYDIQFTLLSDHKLAVMSYFNVVNLPSNPNTIARAKRITFILDEKSRLIYIFDLVKPANHAEEVLKVLDNLK